MPDGSSLPPQPSLDIAKQFWALFAGEDVPIRLQLLPAVPKSAPPCEIEGTLDDLWQTVCEHQSRGYSVYFFVNSTPPGFAGNVTNADVTAVRALFADHDGGLPSEWHCPPSLVVNTSTVEGVKKGAAYWLVSPMPPGEFKEAQQRLIAHYGSDMSVSDPKRVMRLPGTIHRKPAVLGDQMKRLLEAELPVPLTAPQLVSLEDHTAELGRVLAMPPAAVLAGLPPMPERREKAENAAHGRPVSLACLRSALSFINPCTHRHDTLNGTGWFPIVRAIANTPVEGDAWQTKRELAELFMDCELYAGGDADRSHLAGAYRAEWGTVFDQEYESERSYGFGTIMHRARAGGWSMPGGIPKEWQEYLRANPRDDLPAEKHPRLNLMNVAGIRALPDPIELVAGLLIDRENVAFVAEPKTGKTFIALDIALSIAAQRKVLDTYEVKRTGYVVYLSGEGHAGMKRRILAWGAARGLTEAQLDALPFYYNKGVPLAAEGTAEAKVFVEGIRATIEGEMVLAVIDTMSRSLGGMDENAAATAAMYLNMTESLRDGLDCTTLTLAHASNKADRPGKPIDFRGSSGFSGGFDSVWTLDKDDETQTVELAGKWFKEFDLGDRSSIYFRLKQTEAGAVLEPAAPPAKASSAEQKRHSLKLAMVAEGMVGFKKALTDEEFAERLAGTEPQTDPNLTADQNAERIALWQGRVKDKLEDLQKGARSPGRAGVVYKGLFRQGLKPSQAEEMVGRGLKTGAQPGARGRPKAVRLWYLPEGAARVE